MTELKEIKIMLQQDSLANQTNNYDVKLIEENTWSQDITKDSLITLVKEIPENQNQWIHTVILSFLVYAMVFSYRLAEDVLNQWSILSEAIQIIVTFFVTFTIWMAVRHVVRFYRLKQRIYQKKTKPLNKSKKLLDVFIYLLSISAGLVISYTWTEIAHVWFQDGIALIGIGYVIFYGVLYKYYVSFILKNVGVLLHHIQLDLKNQKTKNVVEIPNL
ncbi:hypothetical protein M3649_21130 [Ureibacillus chungkukjangi]|uniref:hypothetical protein n=1 Tax=Ureibacillus chungkukjangi TaxID=1202712 RepID=UPI00203B52DA|nr:hypothetical protein [Ureibacillus chungkukjangi]MCM3390590.1 hypothetical protein [Ureibacillus chungkukjangi]